MEASVGNELASTESLTKAPCEPLGPVAQTDGIEAPESGDTCSLAKETNADDNCFPPVIVEIKKNVQWKRYNRMYPTFSPAVYDRKPLHIIYTVEDKALVFKELDDLREELFPGQQVSSVMPVVRTETPPRPSFFSRFGNSVGSIKISLTRRGAGFGNGSHLSPKGKGYARPSIEIRRSRERLVDDKGSLSDSPGDSIQPAPLKPKRVPMSSPMLSRRRRSGSAPHSPNLAPYVHRRHMAPMPPMPRAKSSKRSSNLAVEGADKSHEAIPQIIVSQSVGAST